MAYLLGVDIGTSGTKTVLFDEHGRTVASCTKEYPLYQPQIGWAEQDADDWWIASRDSIAEVVAKSGVDKRDIKGIGLSGQMHGMVLLDADGKVLRKAIIWCDQRTAAQCGEINALVGPERLIEITGNPPLTAFTAAKVMWVKDNEPDIFDKTRKVLLPKDYVRYKLTGEFASEVSDASGMQFLDINRRTWSREVMDKLGIPFEWLPEVYESYVISGKVTREAAQMTGLWEGLPVAGGGGDQAAGAVGNGIVRPGVVSSTIGTSGVVFAHLDQIAYDPKGRLQTFCHAVPGAWHLMGCTQGAGLSLQWMRNQFGQMEQALAQRMGVDPYVLMGEEAARAKAGCDGLIFLPYMMGERAPHLDPNARGVFFGLTNTHRREEMIRAVMEGVSYSLLDCLNIMRDMGVDPSQVRASGGGGKSPLWRQMQADMFGTEMVTINSSEGPALGVALLAGVGAGVYASVPEACDAAIQVTGSQAPIAENAAAYAAYYPIYRNLYTALKPQYEAVAALQK
ncbi:MAG: xylulokinase [Eubacteriales bacterium]|nr:xylulokinase [Eubacteriales bacterium]